MARSGRGQLGYWGLDRRADPWLCRRRRFVFPLSQPQSQAVAALSAREDELPLPTPSPSMADPAWVSAAAWGRGHGLPRLGWGLAPASTLLFACAAGALTVFAGRPADWVRSGGRERDDPLPLSVRQGFGNWSPGMVRFTSEVGRPTKTNTSERFLFLGLECFIDKVLIPAIYRLYIIEVPCLKERSLTSE